MLPLLRADRGSNPPPALWGVGPKYGPVRRLSTEVVKTGRAVPGFCRLRAKRRAAVPGFCKLRAKRRSVGRKFCKLRAKRI